MDWTKKVGQKQVGRKLGARNETQTHQTAGGRYVIDAKVSHGPQSNV